jgi:sugar phosphate isomerase/epimerase
MKRRDFLRTSTAALAALGLAAAPPLLAGLRRRRVLGLQAFTVLTELERDFEGTLKQVAGIGYKEIETIGCFGRDPKYVRDVFDRHGLVTPSQHLTPGGLYQTFKAFTERTMSKEEIERHWPEVMRVDNVAETIEEAIGRAKVLGQRYIVWQIIWPSQYATASLMDAFCTAMNTAGDLCAKAGLVFCFHNHDREFASVNGYVPYDVIVKNTNPETVKLEMDFYWATKAKVDPVAYFKNNPGRYKQCHLKDSTPGGDFTTPGTGIVDFPNLLAAAADTGIEHYYVEYDRSSDPMGVTRDAYAYLEKLI